MFNVGREFNKFASTQGAGFFGALPQASRRQELRFAGNALSNLTRMQAAKEGIAMAEREGAANRRSSLTNAIIGGIGNIAGAGISAGITHGFNFGGGGSSDGFSATDAATMGMPSGQADVISQGGATYWDTDMPTNSWKPYDINKPGW